MTDEKICPIMSRPIMMTKYTDMGDNVHSEETEAMFKEVPCQREKCMAWVGVVKCDFFDECTEVEDKFHFDKFRKQCQEKYGSGRCYGKTPYCRLIERGA